MPKPTLHPEPLVQTRPGSPPARASAARHRTHSAGRGVGMALLLLATLIVLTGCRRSAAPAGQAAAAPAPASAPASRAALADPRLATPDFVAEPVMPPSQGNEDPRRIISMAPSVTELVFALGLGGRLIGRTQFCTHPPDAQLIEVVGALLDPHVERIMRLQPDLVLVTASSPSLLDRFTKAGLPVRRLPDSSLDDIFVSIGRLGEWTGRQEAAARLTASLRAELERLQAVAKEMAAGRRPKVVFVTGALPVPPRSVWVAGPGSYVDALLSLAGAHNMVNDIAAGRSWLEISAEKIAWMQPDLIIEVHGSAMGDPRDAATAWRQLPGLDHTRFGAIDDPAMLTPGPRVNVMLARLIHALYGEGADRAD